MKRAMLGSVLLAGLMVFSGCGLLFVAHNRPYATRPVPAYCYDCHSLPSGVIYSRCDRYEIMVTHGGYYYRPYHHGRHEEYVYVKFSGSQREKNDRSHRSAGADQYREKSKRGRR